MDSGPGTAYPAPDAVRLSRSRAIGSVSNGKCNSLWHEYKDACYYFGEHANYDEATYHCEKNGAELANITPENGKFILGYIKTESNKNNHWIGGGKSSARDGVVRCPMIKGSTSAPEFTKLICNSAYPYVCMKVAQNSAAGDLSQLLNNPNILSMLGLTKKAQPAPPPIRPQPVFPSSKSVRPTSGNSLAGPGFRNSLNYESYDYGSPKSFDTYDYTGNSKNPPSIRPQLIPATALRPTTELTTTDLNQLKELDPQPIPKNRRFNNRPPHEEKEEQVENEGAAGAIATILAVFAFIIFTYCFVNYYRQRKRQQKKANQKNNEEINKQNELPVENINSDKVSLHPPPKTNPHHTPNYEPPKESLEQATCLEVEIEKKTRLFPRNSSSYHTQAPAHDQDDPPYDDSLAGKKFFDKTQNHQKNLSSKQHHPSTYFQYSFDDQSNSNLIHQLEKKIRGSGNGGGGENYSGRFSRQKTGAQTENLDPYDFIPQITNSARIRYYTYRKQEGKNTNGNSFSQTGHQASNLQDFSKNENNMTCRDMSRSQTLDSILEHGVFEGKGNNLRPAPDMPSPVMRSSQMIAGVDHSDYVPQSSRHFVQHNNETSVKTKPGGKDSALGSKYWDAVNYGDLNPHKQVDYSKSYKHSPKSDAERPRLLLKKSESVSAADMYRNFNKLTRQNSVKNQLNFTGEDHEDLPEMQELTAKFNSMTRPNPSQFSGPIKSLTLDRIPTQIEPSPVKILEKNDQKLDIARVEVENPEIKDEDQTTMADMKNLEIFVSEKPTFDLKGNFLERKENPLGYNCNFDFGLGDIDRDLANFRDSNVEGYTMPEVAESKISAFTELNGPKAIALNPVDDSVKPADSVSNIGTRSNSLETSGKKFKFPKPKSSKTTSKLASISSEIKLKDIPVTSESTIKPNLNKASSQKHPSTESKSPTPSPSSPVPNPLDQKSVAVGHSVPPASTTCQHHEITTCTEIDTLASTIDRSATEMAGSNSENSSQKHGTITSITGSKSSASVATIKTSSENLNQKNDSLKKVDTLKKKRGKLSGKVSDLISNIEKARK